MIDYNSFSSGGATESREKVKRKQKSPLKVEFLS